jgi:hypothetical protein
LHGPENFSFPSATALYPTLTDLIEDVFGLYVPLPVQTFGFMLAMAFLCAAWTLALELKRKEKEGLLQSATRRVLIGAPATTRELAVTGVIGFLVGYKLSFALLHYRAFAEDPQGVLISGEGYLWGGLLVAAAAVYQRHREKKKKQLPEPQWKTEAVSPWWPRWPACWAPRFFTCSKTRTSSPKIPGARCRSSAG